LSKVVQLQEFHEKNGYITEFAGFRLPLWFKGIIPESLAVRNAAGIFDVSHMGRAMVRGKDSQRFLNYVWTNDVASLGVGRGQYSLMCIPEGGIVDDGVVFCTAENEYLVVYNAGNRSRDYEWILANARGMNVSVEDVSDNVAMFAVQGPRARQLVQEVSNTQLGSIPRFGCSWTELAGLKALVTRTGYTGEDGFEIFVWNSPIAEPEKARKVWNELLEVGRRYGLELCGLGARDLLRLEAGLCLYGNDIDEKTNPFEARLGFVVKLHKDFIGRQKLQEIKEKGTQRVRAGLVTLRRAIPRHGFAINKQGRHVGIVTSGTLSPLLNTGIAMGYVERDSSQDGIILEVHIRDRMEGAKVVKLPFYDTTKYGYMRKD